MFRPPAVIHRAMRVTAFSSSRISGSSFPYMLSTPAFGLRLYYSQRMCRPLSDRLLDRRGLFLERPFPLAEHRSFDRVWVLFFYRRWSLCLLTPTCFGAANRKSPGKIPGPHFLSPRIVSSPYRPCRPALRVPGPPSSAVRPPSPRW